MIMIMDVELIKLQKKHLEIVRKWRNSDEVSQYMYSSPKITKEQQKTWFNETSNDPTKMQFVINFDGKDMGVALLYDINHKFDRCYWAFYLGDTSIRGKGIGSKVEYKILNLVFDELELQKLLCEVLAFNTSVVEMHEKFGFRRESYFRNHIIKNNIAYDVIGLALLNSDWQLIKNSLRKKIYKI